MVLKTQTVPRINTRTKHGRIKGRIPLHVASLCPWELLTINHIKWLKKWNVHYNDLRQWGKSMREQGKMTGFKSRANRRELKCSHQGEFLLIHLRRGKIIDSECMVVGGGMVLKILLPPLLLLHCLFFIPLNLAAIICIRIATSRFCATAGEWNLNHLNLRVVSWWEMTYSWHSVRTRGRLSTHGAHPPTKGILKKG